MVSETAATAPDSQIPPAPQAQEGIGLDGAVAPETDLPTQVQELTKAKADLEHRLSSAEGRLKTHVPNEDLVAFRDGLLDIRGLKTEVQGMRFESRLNNIKMSDATEEDKAAQEAALTEEGRQSQESTQFLRNANNMGSDLQLRLAHAGIGKGDTWYDDLTARWVKADTMEALQLMASEVTAHLMDKEAKASDTAKKAANEEAGVMSGLGAGPGTATGRVTLANIVARDTRKMTPKQRTEHSKELDAAIANM